MTRTALMARGLKGAEAPPAGWLHTAVPEGVRLRGLSGEMAALERLERGCHQPGHVDRERSLRMIEEGELRRLAAGALLGPLVETASGQAEDSSGQLLGACIVVWWASPGFWERAPWVADVCVDASWQGRGVGTALLRRAVAACARLGASRIGLSVTEGNPARSLYERLGFTQFGSGRLD
ncbi:MAG: GNAT family N-acetyltransferase [Candidatus Dormibacteraeota bacterium]|nr:GNAT family N-acetyltransferase [Candidatus Dormibacteraeota bacterium]